ncbi:MAG: IclR family transcriptional regulator [Alphaproteobacteria bacterium]|nr:IclR family transcriptional regulator [Alphaproteobacteria bacterium]
MPDSYETKTAIQKAVAVLEAVTSEARPVNLPDLAAQIDLPRQTVHRVATQLADIGLLRRDPARERYSVGARFNRLALAGLISSVQLSDAHSVLVGLADDIEETCNVGMLDDTDVIYLDRVECHWPLRIQLKAGSRVEAYPTAIGKLLLAHLDARIRQRTLSKIKLSALTDFTITDRDNVDEHFARIREQGFSINNQEDYVGLIAAAVPIRNQNGQIIAGLGVHAPLARLSTDDIPTILPKMHAAAEQIGRVLIT